MASEEDLLVELTELSQFDKICFEAIQETSENSDDISFEFDDDEEAFLKKILDLATEMME